MFVELAVVAAMVFWIATKPVTRKVEQLRANPLVTLYFNLDQEGSYVSVRGHASTHDDLETIQRITWRDKELSAMFWPNFPEDYLLIKVQPTWIEVLGEGVEADETTWRPQALQASP